MTVKTTITLTVDSGEFEGEEVEVKFNYTFATAPSWDDDGNDAEVEFLGAYAPQLPRNGKEIEEKDLPKDWETDAAQAAHDYYMDLRSGEYSDDL